MKDEVAVVDFQQVRLDDPNAAVKRFGAVPDREMRFDAVIAGGGMGGVAAAIQSCRRGLIVCLTEETDWLGGQATAQGVSALDENYLVETSGSCRTYQQWRQSIRRHYQSEHGLCRESDYGPGLNPGNCWVSWLAFEPKVGLAELNRLLNPLMESGLLTVLPRHKVVAAAMNGRDVRSIRVVNLDCSQCLELHGKVFLDATELGDLIALCGIEYASGAESQSQTGELHAPEHVDPDNVQDFTYPFVVELRAGENHVIPKPPHFDEFNAKGKFSLNGYRVFENSGQFLPFWTYRRLIDSSLFPSGEYPHDLSMINWDSNDLRGENIIDVPPEVVAARLALGKALSLGFLYWMQTEMPRDDGGNGYPEFKLNLDVLGTTDGLSKYPYIRESRRIIGKARILEGDVTAAGRSSARAKWCRDSVGIGLYPIDIHGRQDVPGTAQPARPFQIPLSAMLPEKNCNVIAAAKNISTTHVTNGCYRLHPVEWAIGEAAGTLAAHAVRYHAPLHRFTHDADLLRDLQVDLVRGGTPIVWFDDVPTEHPAFAAIQFLSISGILPPVDESLSFRPAEPMPDDQARQALQTLDLSGKPPIGLNRGEFANWLFERI